MAQGSIYSGWSNIPKGELSATSGDSVPAEVKAGSTGKGSMGGGAVPWATQSRCGGPGADGGGQAGKKGGQGFFPL